MNYRVVKQFSNGAIDNIYNFAFKIVDFGKILIELFWGFYEIWEAFFLIFWNALMYVYYLLLFGIDRSTESQSTVFFWKKIPVKTAYKPSKVFTGEMANPIPGRYGRAAAATVSKAVSATVSTAGEMLRKAPSGAKINILKSTLEFFRDLFITVKNVVLWPYERIAEGMSRRMRPVKEEDMPGRKSLIDEYLKEYEQKRRP